MTVIGSTGGHLIKLVSGLELRIRILELESYGFIRDKHEEQAGVVGQGSMDRNQ